jgi:hypothetical protein
MASFAAKMVAKKIFAESAANKQGQEVSMFTLKLPLKPTNTSQDPYFETVPATRLGFKTKKKLPRALPPGLTPKEEKVLVKAKRRAYKLDMALGSFLGTKIGYGAVIGLVPAFGDVADMLMALMVYRTICSVDPPLPSGLKMRMQINIIIDFILGIVPFIGDIADAVYKCNTKNVILLESELRKRGEKRIQGTPQANQVDPSLPDEFDYQAEADANARNGPPPRYTSTRGSRRDRDRRERRDRREHDVERDAVSAPQPARTR